MNAMNESWGSANETDVLRLITAGSVDDGKSTLIGRLLYDSKGVFADQLASISRSKYKRTAASELDLALLTDGLEAEREQGITIDVAYRYFATPLRKFIVADAPEIGRASCRERVCQYVEISVGAVALHKKKK